MNDHSPRRWGDFGPIATEYHHWPSHSPLVLDAILKAASVDGASIVAEIGAGSGMLISLLQTRGLCGFALEPNEKMRCEGQRRCGAAQFIWSAATAENTGLGSGSIDWVVLANTFHWVEPHRALKEAHRILRKNGHLTLLWMLRDTKSDPILQQIENIVEVEAPGIRRTHDLVKACMSTVEDMFLSSDLFCECIYLEAPHVETLSRERYSRAWRTITDVPSQIGPSKWRKILARIDAVAAGLDFVDMHMRSFAWTARSK